MKKSVAILLTAFVVGFLLPDKVCAQSPDAMSYQVIVRDAGGNLVSNSSIGIQITILKGAVDGTAVFVERHFPSSNANGLVSLAIGTGTTISGDFSTIDWANDTYFIKSETDLNGGSNYTITGTDQLLSVPYALHAKTAESITGGITETDPVYTSSAANSISSADITNWNNKLDTEIDGSVTNEIQNLNDVLTQGTDAGSKQIKNLAAPVDAQDAAKKAYVDQLEAQLEEIKYAAGMMSVKDIDGNEYRTVKIGDQIWMAENLRVTKEPDGTAIPIVITDSDWGALEDTDKGYCYYASSADSLEKYGNLYTYAAALVACPTGWHLPSNAEWTELKDFITNDGHSGTEGTALKNCIGWKDGGNGTNDYMFSALPGGRRNNNTGAFSYAGSYGYWWSATEFNSDNAYYHFLYYTNSVVYRNGNDKSSGFSVRCVRDN